YKGARIQVVDLPGLIEGAAKGRGRGKEVLAAARIADLIVIVTDVFNLHAVDVIKRELYEAGIRLDQKPPDVTIRKKERGGVRISSTVPLSIDESTIVEILKEYKIHSADVVIREDLTIDRLIDALSGNRVYIPSLVVVNKIDIYDVEPDFEAIKISAEKGINIEELKEAIFRKLDFIRVYLKPPGGKASEEPMVLRRGATIEDICRRLHEHFLRNFRYARVWGKSVKFDGQHVGLDHVVEDGDIVTIYA
ncbi:MAG: TGS domain-containing protein, partial [Archaeoglobaceae archaeon]